MSKSETVIICFDQNQILVEEPCDELCEGVCTGFTRVGDYGVAQIPRDGAKEDGNPNL